MRRELLRPFTYGIHLTLIFLCSCTMFRDIRLFNEKFQDYLFSSHYDPGINEKIKTNGLYLLYNDSTGVFVNTPSYVLNQKYEDKYFTYGIGFNTDGSFYYVHYSHTNLFIKDIDGCFDNLILGSDGIYKVKGDYLYADDYLGVYHGTGTAWELYKWEYNILNDSTLRFRQIIRIRDNEIVSLLNNDDKKYVYKFVPFSKIPSKNYYMIKEKKWMWENKEDWKAYKRELKAFKKEQKKARKEQKKQSQGLPRQRYE